MPATAGSGRLKPGKIWVGVPAVVTRRTQLPLCGYSRWARSEPMAARSGWSLHQLTKGRLLPIGGIDHKLVGTGDAVRAASIDQLMRKGFVEI
ncbi:hypothetical protein ACVWWI_006718 [Bradyrhizobium sp. USDA 3686]